MTTPRVTAVLVNFNAGQELRKALQSIADEMAGQPWEAFVIDNASVDGSGAIAEEFAPHARLVANTENIGFARGQNQGMRLSSAPFVLVMNPDCQLVSGSMATMMAVFERHPTCAIVGPRILNPDGSTQGSARGDPDMLTGLFGRTTFLRKVFPELAVSRRNVVPDTVDASGDSFVVDWLSGACMLLRRDAMAQIEGFDERYFLYWEDADLCRRLRAAGYQVRYQPGATAVHRVAHSSRRTRAVAIRAFHDSAYLYYSTHVAPGGNQRRLDRRVRRRLKRILARWILSARCRLHLRGAKA